jgi:hypothetical protein
MFDWKGYGRKRPWPTLRDRFGTFLEGRGKTAENLKISGPRFEPGNSRRWSISAKHSFASFDQSSCWEANCHSASQEIPVFYWIRRFIICSIEPATGFFTEPLWSSPHPRILKLSVSLLPGSGAHLASCTVGTGGSFPGGKARPGRDADHSPPSSAEVNKE